MPRAPSYFTPFSNALITALQLITAGLSPLLGNSFSKKEARGQRTPFPHALNDALQLNMSDCNNSVYISSTIPRVASHFMAFSNALNEAARDSDVFRMFARGKGFLATVKCQWAFRIGVAAVWIAMFMCCQANLGWEIVIIFFLSAVS